MALDVLIDGLPDHVGQVTVLSPRDLFELGPAVCVEAQAVVLRRWHGLHPALGGRASCAVCTTLQCSAMHSYKRVFAGIFEGRDKLGDVPVGDPAQLADLDAVQLTGSVLMAGSWLACWSIVRAGEKVLTGMLTGR